MNKILLFILCLFAPPLALADFEADLSATHSANNIQALRDLRNRAVAGDAEAQFNLGSIFFKGEELEKDYKEAAKWIRLAANQGHTLSQYNMGMMYDSGQGVIKDHAEAARWYRYSAEGGFALAQLNLGVAYANGEGVAQDMAEALRWIRQAADQGEVQALFDLGVMYGNGQGTKQNLLEAYRCASLAAGKGHEMANSLLNDLSQKMTPKQIETAKKLARENQKTQLTHADIRTITAVTHSPAPIEPESIRSMDTIVPPAAETESEGKQFYVQLGAFRSKNQADEFMQKMYAKLESFDRPCKLFTSEGWVRIQVGPYPDQHEARLSADNLKIKLGYEPKLRQH